MHLNKYATVIIRIYNIVISFFLRDMYTCCDNATSEVFGTEMAVENLQQAETRTWFHGLVQRQLFRMWREKESKSK